MAYSTTTRATLRTRIRETLLNNFWTDTELNLYINEALRVWNTLTGYFRTSASYTIPAATSTHSTSTATGSDGWIILRLETTSIHLNPINLAEISSISPGWWSNTAGTPSSWIPLGLNRFATDPQPSSGLSHTIDYVRTAPLPTSDSSFIQIGEEDMLAIIDYVIFISKLKEGGDELAGAQSSLQNFLKQAAKYNSRLLQISSFRTLLGLPMGGQRNLRPDMLDKASVR